MVKIYPQLISLFALIAFCTYSCTHKAKDPGKSSINFIVVDEKPDSINPAGIEELKFNSSGSTIYGFEYKANGAGPHPTVILLHGLPGNERNLDLAQNLRRAGYNVVFFNYRGSWGSEGIYSFSNSLADIGSVIDHLTDPKNQELLRIDVNRIALIGHSQGAGLALIEGINDPRVKAIAGISVFNPYTIFKGNETKGNLTSLKEYISSLGVLNCDPNTYLKELLSNVISYNIEELVKKTKKPILIIDEHKNNMYLNKYKDKETLKYQIWSTDHAFTNKRIALSVELNNWLLKNLSR
ncbi:alpha/beta hydrolase family protein [Daejeonella oryzae]|uniref:alpha/beta hydrolase family protein n=1 Tax=Daejeonella oryzae TaxID=1122943 RepID=UPI00040F98C5|nr:alpha/beta fold hydrolase [Daejeonella oryzae]